MNAPLKPVPSGQVLPVAPVLWSPTAQSTGPTTATLTFTTDQPGIVYWIGSPSGAEPTTAQIMAGQDSTGAKAAAGSSQRVLVPGVQTIAASGLPSGESLNYFFMQANARFLVSNIIGTAIADVVGELNFSQPPNSGLLALLEDI